MKDGSQALTKKEILQKIRLNEMLVNETEIDTSCTIEIIVHPKVYHPGTDTRLLARTIAIPTDASVLDLCTGTGIIACKMSLLGAGRVVGVDLNPRAVQNAQENVARHKLTNVEIVQGNMFAGLKEKFDVITINPPYTDASPSDEFDICFYDKDHASIRTFFTSVKDFLTDTGYAYIGWSNIGPMDLLPKLAKENKLHLELLSTDKGRTGYKFYVYKLTRT